MRFDLNVYFFYTYGDGDDELSVVVFQKHKKLRKRKTLDKLNGHSPKKDNKDKEVDKDKEIDR